MPNKRQNRNGIDRLLDGDDVPVDDPILMSNERQNRNGMDRLLDGDDVPVDELMMMSDAPMDRAMADMESTGMMADDDMQRRRDMMQNTEMDRASTFSVTDPREEADGQAENLSDLL